MGSCPVFSGVLVNIGYGNLCMREKNLNLNNNYMISELLVFCLLLCALRFQICQREVVCVAVVDIVTYIVLLLNIFFAIICRIINMSFSTNTVVWRYTDLLVHSLVPYVSRYPWRVVVNMLQIRYSYPPLQFSLILLMFILKLPIRMQSIQVRTYLRVKGWSGHNKIDTAQKPRHPDYQVPPNGYHFLNY